MPFPSQPNAANNGWIQRMIQPFYDWCFRRQCIPDPNDFAVTEGADGIRFSILPEALSSASSHPLKLRDATAGGAALIRVVYGEVNGTEADSGMYVGDDPAFTVTLSANGVRIVYLDLTLSYSAPLWSFTYCAISQAATLPTATATHAYFKIGQAERESDGSGGFRVKGGTISQSIFGSVDTIRRGSGGGYTDHKWLA